MSTKLIICFSKIVTVIAMYNDTHIFVNGSELTKVSHTKFLGVHIDKSLIMAES